jgi:hypothetical protein
LKTTFILVLILASTSLPLAFSASQVTVTQSSGQTESPLVIKDNSGTILFQVFNDGTNLVNQFIKFSQSGLSTIKTYVFPDSNGVIVLQNTTDTFTGTKTFGTNTPIGRLAVAGATSGSTIINASAVAGSSFVTLPTSGTLATLENTETFTGVKTFTGNATLQNPQINGLDLNYTSFSADHTGEYLEDVVSMDSTSANRVFTLPTAVGHTGKIFTVRNSGLSATFLTQIITTNSQTINGYTNLNMTHRDQTTVLQSDGANWITIENSPPVPSDYFIRGSTTRWYGNNVNQVATTTLISAASTLRATPWIVSQPMKIDKMEAEIMIPVGNPTTNLCRIGIYRDNGNVYPDQLVAGTGSTEFDTTLGVKPIAVSPITLQPGLYWHAWTCGTAGTTQPTFRAVGVSAVPPVLGIANTMGTVGAGTFYTVAFTYAVMPDTFPAGATITSGVAPTMILVEIVSG